jgi:hypothetical protein
MKKGSTGMMGMINMPNDGERMNTARVKILNKLPRLNTEYYKTKLRETYNIYRSKKTACKLQML